MVMSGACRDDDVDVDDDARVIEDGRDVSSSSSSFAIVIDPAGSHDAAAEACRRDPLETSGR